jgi:hypothetical protein
MIRTVNGGSQWYEVASCPACVKVAAGAPKSGRNYPTLYAFGQFVIEGVRTGWCIARCDDATADPSQPLTWTFLSDAPAGELQSISSMSADPEVYGKFYIGASGIIIGESA